MHAAVRTIDSMASAVLDPVAGRIDGTHTPDELIEVIDITDAHEIVMATDGCIEPRRTLAESEKPLAERIARDLQADLPLRLRGQLLRSTPTLADSHLMLLHASARTRSDLVHSSVDPPRQSQIQNRM